jgi:hypothetical protein
MRNMLQPPLFVSKRLLTLALKLLTVRITNEVLSESFILNTKMKYKFIKFWRREYLSAVLADPVLLTGHFPMEVAETTPAIILCVLGALCGRLLY